MDIITLNKENLDSQHICCAIWDDKENKQRAESKKQWLRQRFDEWLVFKKYDLRWKVFLEYADIENCWKPLVWTNCYVINCLWVAWEHQWKGYARALLHECIKEAQNTQKDWICVIVNKKKKPFAQDKKFFTKFGFEIIDKADPDYELLAYKIKQNIDANFTENAKSWTCENKKWFSIIYTNQCPFNEVYSKIMQNYIISKWFECKVSKLANRGEVIKYAWPNWSFSLYFDGRFVWHEIIINKKLDKLLEQCKQ